MQGIINLNKPAGLSSARCVSRIKRLLPPRTKIGHAGTLDPFATGVLLLLVGKATRLCERLMDAPKAYRAIIQLGGNTPTDDPESEVTSTQDCPIPDRPQVEQALVKQVGNILQKPPVFSALKVGGRRAYDLARQGKQFELAPRQVKVYSIELLEYAWPNVAIDVRCGRGVYIRSIARQLGDDLATGGYLSALCRTETGGFNVDNSRTIESLDATNVEAALFPIENIFPDDQSIGGANPGSRKISPASD